nr:odorant binding protein 14 [Trissolcus basalis]
MKVFVVACFAFSAIIVLSNAEHTEEYKEATEKCLQNMKVSTDDFLKMIENDDDSAACIFACINKEVKIFDGDKFDSKKIHEEVKKQMVVNEMEYTVEMKNSMDKCIEAGNNATGDECEKTGAFMECIFTDKELTGKLKQ